MSQSPWVRTEAFFGNESPVLFESERLKEKIETATVEVRANHIIFSADFHAKCSRVPRALVNMGSANGMSVFVASFIDLPSNKWRPIENAPT